MGLPGAGAAGGGGAIGAETFSGRAYVAEARLSALTHTVVMAGVNDTGPHGAAAPDGFDAGLGFFGHVGVDVVSHHDDEELSLDAEVASSSTAGSGGETNSAASVAGVRLGVGNVKPHALVVEAQVLRAEARAYCTSRGVRLGGGSKIAALSVNGRAVVLKGGANETIELAGLATVVLNEQIRSAGSITVNALHVILHQETLLGRVLSGDVVISSASAGVTCPGGTPPPPRCPVKDFVTGGGYVMDGGDKVTFGMVGGDRGDSRSGHFNAIHHGSGTHLTAGTLTGYAAPSPTRPKRVLTYSGEVDGAPATIVVEVTDKGEPGDDDLFSVKYSLASAPGAFHQWAAGTLDGGNIRLHTPGGCQTATKGRG